MTTVWWRLDFFKIDPDCRKLRVIWYTWLHHHLYSNPSFHGLGSKHWTVFTHHDGQPEVANSCYIEFRISMENSKSHLKTIHFPSSPRHRRRRALNAEVSTGFCGYTCPVWLVFCCCQTPQLQWHSDSKRLGMLGSALRCRRNRWLWPWTAPFGPWAWFVNIRWMEGYWGRRHRPN